MSFIINSVSIGILCGFLHGVYKTAITLWEQAYLHHKLYVLALNTLLSDLQRHTLSLFWIVLAGACLWYGLAEAAKKLRKTPEQTPAPRSFLSHRLSMLLRISAGMAAGVLICLSGGLAAYRQLAEPDGPNIIIIVIDALRKDHVGVYGYKRDTTPCIDHFARSAVVFKRPVSQSSWTAPAVSSLFTSLYPSAHDVNGLKVTLNKKLVTFAEKMKNRGYATVAFVANPYISKNFYFDQGFDLFDEINDSYKPLASDVNSKALPWLAEHSRSPFFMYLHYMDVHGPYGAPEPYDTFFTSPVPRPMTQKEIKTMRKFTGLFRTGNSDLNYYMDRYDGAIRYVDHHIGKLLETLQHHGLYENSIIMITSDHGETFFEHGMVEHGCYLYTEEIDIPLIMKLPRHIAGHIDTNRLIGLVDVMPFIEQLIEKPLSAAVHNRALPAPVGTDRSFSELLRTKKHGSPWSPIIAMVKDGYKAIYSVQSGTVTELYDMRYDPEEQHNIAEKNTDLCLMFKRNIEDWRSIRLHENRRHRADRNQPSVYKKKQLERLKALGYIQ